jgi:hypothetical protein
VKKKTHLKITDWLLGTCGGFHTYFPEKQTPKKTHDIPCRFTMIYHGLVLTHLLVEENTFRLVNQQGYTGQFADVDLP